MKKLRMGILGLGEGRISSYDTRRDPTKSGRGLVSAQFLAREELINAHSRKDGEIMKRLFIFWLALLLTFTGSSLIPAAQGNSEELTDIICAEQGYATKMPADLSAEWFDGDGLYIWVGDAGYVPDVNIWRRNKLNDPEKYVKVTVQQDMKEELGSRLVGTSLFDGYESGGRNLIAAEYIYKDANGYTVYLLHAVDLRDDSDVEYYVRYTNSTREETLNALDIAVRNFRELEEEEGSSDIVYCKEQDFSFQLPEGASFSWVDGRGLRVYLEEEGYVPHITIWRRSENLSDPVDFVDNDYREYMEEEYGENFYGSILYEAYEAGEKTLAGAKYYFRTNDTDFCRLLLIESREDGDVEYYINYVEDEGGLVPAELEGVIESYSPGRQENQEPQTQGQEPQPPTGVTLPGLTEYGDDRFHILLPERWKIKTTGDYTVFSFKAWDPAETGRSFFFFMKLEPFMKSWEAKKTYQSVVDGSFLDSISDPVYREMLKQIYAQTGGGELYQLYADAPVMEECDLDSFLYTVPDIREYAKKYYSTGMFLDYTVLPDMKDIRIADKKTSSLPAPASCYDNSIARITFTNDEGTACEGLVSAQPVDTVYVDFFGVDGSPYSVYVFSGVTAPKGELEAFEPLLSSCLGSFGFEEDYVKKSLDISNAEKEALLQQAEQSQALHDAMAQAWDEMIRN